MSSGQGWLESDTQYRERVEREANERTISGVTGSAPSQGWLENAAAYAERIASEAHEHIIESNTGSAPRQGWIESDEDYTSRIEQEANESTVNSATGNALSQGWLESDESYNTRVRREANKHSISGETGITPSQGWLEGDYPYRQRINHEANEHRSRSTSLNSSKTGGTGKSFSRSSSGEGAEGNGFGGVTLLLFICGVVWLFIPSSTPPPIPSSAFPPAAEIPRVIGPLPVNIKNLAPEMLRQISILNGAGLTISREEIGGMRLAGENGNTVEYNFRDGQRVLLSGVAPSFNSFVYVDYYDLNGNVTHLLPSIYSIQNEFLRDAAFAIGADFMIEIGPPFGRELIIFYALSDPLGIELRPFTESTQSYSEWLLRRLENLRGQNPHFRGEFVYMIYNTSQR